MQRRAFDDPKMRFLWNSEVVDVLGEDKLAGVSAAQREDR